MTNKYLFCILNKSEANQRPMEEKKQKQKQYIFEVLSSFLLKT